MNLAHSMSIPPYGEIRIGGGSTFALLNANVPHVFLRLGSDSIRVPVGHCYNTNNDFVMLVNPFPRKAELTVARGIPVRFGFEDAVVAGPQIENTVSILRSYRPALVTGRKYAVGFMLKRGSAGVLVSDAGSDTKSSIMLFRNSRRNFLSFKPSGAMDDDMGQVFRYSDGTVDENIEMVAGTYTDQNVVDWAGSAGYDLSQRVTIGNYSNQMNNLVRFRVDTETAFFYVRDIDVQVSSFLRVFHNGASLEEYR